MGNKGRHYVRGTACESINKAIERGLYLRNISSVYRPELKRLPFPPGLFFYPGPSRKAAEEKAISTAHAEKKFHLWLI